MLSSSLYTEASRRFDPDGQEHFPPASILNGFTFNFDDDNWGDRRLCQSLSMAFDHDDMLEVLDPTGHGAWMSTLPPALEPYFLDPSKPEFGPQAKWYTKNISEAKKLMAAATGSDEVKIEITSNAGRYGSATQQFWELQASLILEAGFASETTMTSTQGCTNPPRRVPAGAAHRSRR